MTELRPNLYPIKGGIGKCVIFTALIDRLAAHDGRKIAVAGGFPNVFRFHPQVATVLPAMTPEAIMPVVEQFEDIVWREPYISNFCKGDRHILDEWAKLYGLEPLAGGGFHARPDLHLPDQLVEEGEKVRAQLTRRFFIVQWTGGQPPMNLRREGRYPDNHLTKARNVRNYQAITAALAEAYPEHLFVLYALPNEPVEVPESLRERIVRAKAPTLAYAALLRHADGFVALDSSLQHFAAARQVGRKGVVLWGHRTTAQQLGYAFHTNLGSVEQEGVVVPPERVVEALKKIVPN